MYVDLMQSFALWLESRGSSRKNAVYRAGVAFSLYTLIGLAAGAVLFTVITGVPVLDWISAHSWSIWVSAGVIAAVHWRIAGRVGRRDLNNDEQRPDVSSGRSRYRWLWYFFTSTRLASDGGRACNRVQFVRTGVSIWKQSVPTVVLARSNSTDSSIAGAPMRVTQPYQWRRLHSGKPLGCCNGLCSNHCPHGSRFVIAASADSVCTSRLFRRCDVRDLEASGLRSHNQCNTRTRSRCMAVCAQ